MLLKQGMMSVDYVFKHNNTEEAIQDSFDVVRKARSPFLLPVSDDEITNVYQQHPKLRRLLFLSTGADALILLDTTTLKSISALPLLLELHDSNVKNIRAKDKDYIAGLSNGLTAGGFTYPYPKPIEVLKGLMQLITMTQTSRVEGIFNMIDFNSILSKTKNERQAYQQVVRYIYLYTRKIIEYPTAEFDKGLLKVIRRIPRNIDVLSDDLRQLVKDMEKPLTGQAQTLYRGDTVRNTEKNQLHYQESLSWTTNYPTAQFFAKRFSTTENSKDGKIYTVKVPTDFVLAEYADEDEPECLLDPKIWKQKPEVSVENV